jgi:hypothetical protein
MRTFVVCTLYKMLLGSTKKDEMDGACSLFGEMRKAYKILVGKSENKRPLGRSGRRWEDILKWVSNKWSMNVKIGLKWLGIGSSGGLL